MPGSPVAWVERSLRAEVPRLGHVPELDGIRGWLVFPVFWTHYAYLEYAGAIALDMFFALSGFLITTLLLEERERNDRISIRQFYVRRGVRLLPELVVAMAFQVALALAGVFATRTTIIEAAGALLYVYALVGGFVTDPDELRMFHLWSLTLEEWFYLSWAPLMAGFFAVVRRRTAVAWVVVAVGSFALLGLRALAWRSEGPNGFLELRPEQLMFGALIALVRRNWLDRRAAGAPSRWERVLPAMMPLFVLSVVGCWVATIAYDDGHADWRWIVRPVGMLACCGAVLGTVLGRELGVVTRLVRPKWVITLGITSYGAYIWHMVPFILVNGEANFVAKELRFPVWGQMLVVTPLAIALGWASHRWVFTPVRDRHRAWQARSAARPSSQLA